MGRAFLLVSGKPVAALERYSFPSDASWHLASYLQTLREARRAGWRMAVVCADYGGASMSRTKRASRRNSA